MAMRLGRYLGLGPHGFHGVGYAEWGRSENRHVVVCVHGLTRTGRDFDRLAEALESDFRVVCPDVAGRGRSDWLPHKDEYGYPSYLSDMACLIARLGVEAVHWVGTSMGGLIGMMLAAQPNTPIRSLLLNDIGPYIPEPAVKRIAGYVGTDPRFSDVEGVERYLREVHGTFGPLTDAQWRHLAEYSARRVEDHVYALHYDPGIAVPFREMAASAVDLWPVWDAVRCPALVLRGAASDVLLPETAREMETRGPGARTVEFPGVGHAPALMAEGQIAAVAEWLRQRAA